MSSTGELGQYYRKTMLYPQKDNQIPFPSGNSGKINVFFNSLLRGYKMKTTVKIDALKTLMEPDLRNLGIETFPI
ncbi:hypothetical protein, partial [Thiolapillus sp.]